MAGAMRSGRSGAAAAAAALCCLLAAAAAQSTNEWGTCGGLHGPNGKDAAGAKCPQGYTCVRQDE
jgi:hypothetical protein